MSDTTAERIADGAAAAQAMEFVRPALDVIRADYNKRAMELLRQGLTDPVKTAGAQKLSIALGVIDQVEAQIRAVISDGNIAKASHERASDMARVSEAEARRSFL